MRRKESGVMANSGVIYGCILAMLFALAAGLVGCFALMKRMLLAADVISHVALPGLGLAFLFGFNPLLGGAAALLGGTLLVWQLQKKTGLATEAMIGVVFAGALALGALVTPEEHLAEALFGRFEDLTLVSFLAGMAAVVLILLAVLRFKDAWLLNLFSPDLAAATGIRLNRGNLYFLMIFALTVLVGLRYMGALLAGALIIVPAATSRRLVTNISHFLTASCIISAVSVAAGLLISQFVFPQFSPGPATAIVAAIIFAVSLLVKKT
jgi:zinc transport system permease protein